MPANNVTIYAESQSYQRINGFTFSGNSVTGYTQNATSITIPAYYDTVTINSQDYFIERESGTSLQVLNIGDNAFEGNINLEEVILPDGLLSIGQSAFKDCTNLEEVCFAKASYYDDGSVSGESQLETIKSQAFYNCSKLYYLESFSGTKLNTIENLAFYNCESMVDITLPSTLATIGDRAFELCTSLAIVVNESSLISIAGGQTDNGYVGYYAYRAVNKTDSPNARVYEDWVDGGGKYYIDSDKSETIAIGAVGNTKPTTIWLYATITEILAKAFSRYTELTNVYYLKTIDDWAQLKFGADWAPKNNNVNLYTSGGVATDITINASSISDYAFQSVTSIENVLIGNSVMIIGAYAFAENPNLLTVTCDTFGWNSALTQIGDYAFAGCGGSPYWELGEGMRTIMIAGGMAQFDGISHNIFDGTVVDVLIISNTYVCSWSDAELEELVASVEAMTVKVNERCLVESGNENSSFFSNFTESEGLYVVWNLY